MKGKILHWPVTGTGSDCYKLMPYVSTETAFTFAVNKINLHWLFR